MGESTKTTPPKRRPKSLNLMMAERTWSCSRIRHLQSGAAAAGGRFILGMGPWNISWAASCRYLQHLQSCIHEVCVTMLLSQKMWQHLFLYPLLTEPNGFKNLNYPTTVLVALEIRWSLAILDHIDHYFGWTKLLSIFSQVPFLDVGNVKCCL